MYFSLMDDERFRQLLETARKAFNTKGDNVTVRSQARRQYQQTIDLLSLECEPEQWAEVRAQIASRWT